MQGLSSARIVAIYVKHALRDAYNVLEIKIIVYNVGLIQKVTYRIIWMIAHALELAL
jgi:hypothetical protein